MTGARCTCEYYAVGYIDYGIPTSEVLAIPACQTRWTNTASSVIVTGGVVEAVEVSTGWKKA